MARRFETERELFLNSVDAAIAQTIGNGFPFLSEHSALTAAEADRYSMCVLEPKGAALEIGDVALQLKKANGLAQDLAGIYISEGFEYGLRVTSTNRSEPLDTIETGRRILAKLVELGVASPGCPLEKAVWMHAHFANTPSGCCLDAPCRRMALCHAGMELLDIMDTPSRAATRQLIRVEHNAAAWLLAWCRITEEAWFGEACGRPGQQRPLEATSIVRELLPRMKRIAGELQRLEHETSSLTLYGPRDQRPRGFKKQVMAPVLLAMSLHLDRAGYSCAEIGRLLVVADDLAPTDNCRERLHKHRKNDSWLRTTHIKNSNN